MIRAALFLAPLALLANAAHAQDTSVTCGINLMRGGISDSQIQLQCGLSADQVAALRAEHERTRAEIARNRDLLLQILEATGKTAEALESGVSGAALIELARRISEDVTDVRQAMAELDRAVAIAIDVQREARDNPSTDTFVAEVERRIADLSGAGRFDEATAEAERALALWDAEQQNQRQRGLRLLEAALVQDILRRDADAAADRIARMAGLSDADLFVALRDAFAAFHMSGLEKGFNFDLEVAIALARRAHAIAGDPDRRGAALNHLAVAQSHLGAREPGTARLEEAIATYGAALQERTRDRVPLDWATTQNNLGNALQTLGARETGTARLEQAVAAYRAALQVRTRDRVPLEWATTQNNLGAALQTLGARESGTDRLDQAVAAYRAALQERTRDRDPPGWATTQNNLGNALRALAERAPGTDHLQAAVAAYGAALQVWTRDRVPLDWAMAQNNLGNVLLMLGERDTDSARLEQAVVAYRAALQECTRERVPLDWAATQNNLGAALQSLAAGEAGTDRLDQAVAAYRAALQERTRERVPLEWASTQINLARAELAYFDRTADPARLDTAEAHVRAARAVFAEARAGHQLAMADARLADIAARRATLAD